MFSHSNFGKALEDGSLVLPEPSPLPQTTGPELPFVIVRDEAFPLKNYLLRPFPGRNLPGSLCSSIYLFHLLFFTFLEDQAVFNYRLSRVCRIIENAFGILAARYNYVVHSNNNKIIAF